MDNGITPRLLETALDRVLDFMSKRNISSERDLEGLVGTKEFISARPLEFIGVEKNPAGRSFPPTSYAHTINYIIDGKGIIVEVRINSEENYSLLTVKMNGMIQGYEKRALDVNGNIIQSRVTQNSEVGVVRGQISALKDYLSKLSN